MPTTFRCVVPGGVYFRGSCIFEAPLGCGKGVGREWQVDAHNFPLRCSRRGTLSGFLHF